MAREHPRRVLAATWTSLSLTLSALQEALVDIRTRRMFAGALAATVLTIAAVVVLVSDGHQAGGATETTGGGGYAIATARTLLVDVFPEPGAPEAVLTLEHPTPRGSPLVFLVTAEQGDWLEVRVPTPPVDRGGWIRSADVSLRAVDMRIRVDLTTRTLVVTDRGRVVLQAPLAVGRFDAPRPGLTFITDRFEQSRNDVKYGHHVLTLAGYPNGEDAFFRESGLVALHGADDPSTIGRSVFEGSLGLEAAAMERLFRLAPAGTPVEIVGS